MSHGEVRTNKRIQIFSRKLEDKKIEASCDSGNEPSGSIKCGEFVEQLRDCHLPMHSSATCGPTFGIKTT